MVIDNVVTTYAGYAHVVINISVITNHVVTARVGFPQLVIDNVVITLAGFLLRISHNIVTVRLGIIHVHFLLNKQSEWQ